MDRADPLRGGEGIHHGRRRDLTVVKPLPDGFTVAVIPTPWRSRPSAVVARRPRQPGGGRSGQYAERLLSAIPGQADSSGRKAHDRSPIGAVRTTSRRPSKRWARATSSWWSTTSRENEGDLIMAAEHATAEKIALLRAAHIGAHRVPMTGERLDELDIPLMVKDNTESQRTAFTYSVDYRHGTSTGISAADRAATIQALIDPGTRPADLARPGTSSRCVTPTAACSSAPATPKRPSTSPAWPGLYPRATSAGRQEDGTMAESPTWSSSGSTAC